MTLEEKDLGPIATQLQYTQEDAKAAINQIQSLSYQLEEHYRTFAAAADAAVTNAKTQRYVAYSRALEEMIRSLAGAMFSIEDENDDDWVFFHFIAPLARVLEEDDVYSEEMELPDGTKSEIQRIVADAMEPADDGDAKEGT